MAACRTVVALALLYGCVCVLGIAVDDEDYDAACHKDKLEEPDAFENYVDCTTPEKVEAGLVRCCTVGAGSNQDVGCCETETKNEKMLAIGLSIGFVTAGIMTACIIVFWCNSSTFPCLEKYENKIWCLRKKDRSLPGLTDSATATSNTALYNGLNPKYSHEGFRGDEFAPPEKYDMPPELRETVKDDWWGVSTAQPLKFY